MHPIARTYLVLTVLTTLATSLIWGIDTLFLLAAGLSNAEVFLVNSCFMVGSLVFEVPTGVVADTWGRRWSFLIGCVWLAVSTAAYGWLGAHQGHVWAFGLASGSLGIGYTFFTGAIEAWLVDELKVLGEEKRLGQILGWAQSAGGAAMLLGAVGGGLLAEQFGLPLPYILRVLLLLVSFGVGCFVMRETGFKPTEQHQTWSGLALTTRQAMKVITDHPVLSWLVLAAPFMNGIGYYTFYAAQPFLLQLYGDSTAYSIAGVAAALVALSRILGGLLAAQLTARLSTLSLQLKALAAASLVTAVCLALLGLVSSFAGAVVILFVWGLMFALTQPIRQTVLNQAIPSQQRATVLSFDSLLGSVGGVVLQPGLGWMADVYGYSRSFLAGASGSIIVVPLTLLADRNKKKV